MQYVEAFNALGYDVPNPRQDWSAEKAGGVCITLWKSEVQWVPTPPHLDLWAKAGPGTTDWETLPGHKKRTGHLARAVSEFDGWVDVIIVTGTPGKGYGNADPWLPEKRANHGWRIQKFDKTTGFFSVVAEKLK
ncbi:MAG: hypothetical protein KDE03_15795 [Rhodobacteraceae bacterium]|nr:hypothetical protein [Paracoccaceae bacterium]